MIKHNKQKIVFLLKELNYNHKIDGKNLYLDMKKEIMKAKNSHFEIETTK